MSLAREVSPSCCIPSESVIREEMLAKFGEVRGYEPLTCLLEEYGREIGLIIDARNLNYKSMRSELLASRCHDWWGADVSPGGVIGLGFYKDENCFATMFFHELGHSLLAAYGRTPQQSEKYVLEEETFCWCFSKKCCELLAYEYIEELGDVCYAMMMQKLVFPTDRNRWEEWLERYETLVQIERRVNGFSSEGGDVVHWESGIPVRRTIVNGGLIS